MGEAERIVREAQEESRARNTYLVNHVRKNKYELKDFSVSKADSAPDPLTATGVNDTVANAAAVVTKFLSLNDTMDRNVVPRQSSTYWMENMVQNGISPFVANATYKVWRDVKSYGAKGDGITDDTASINRAIQDGNRCGRECGSTTTLQAVIYFPSGTYLVSGTLNQYFFTQFIGNSNFYRQVRNLEIDITDAPLDAYIAAIHWQIAQATSLQNMKFTMSTVPGNNQQGIFMENGSGGFMSDLEFIGGSVGAYVGNQQFSVRNLKFSNHQTSAIQIHWDWGWTWKGVDISNCPVAITLSTPGTVTEVGSAIFIDSKITNCPVAIEVQKGSDTAAATLSIFSLQTTNVPIIVKTLLGETLLTGSAGTMVTRAWGIGRRYDTDSEDSKLGGTWQFGGAYPRAPEISSSLLKVSGDQNSGFFERSKPQYELVAASNFVNVKLAPYNAIGDGVHDDKDALNSALRAVAGTAKILWIPAGVYLTSDTIFIPAGAKVVGQSWSQIMGAGTNFQNINSPRAVVKVGNVGDVGSVEIQDLLFTVKGKAAGAIVLQWNIHEASPGSAAMWDTHIRVGGAKGSDLQVANCPKQTGTVNPNCIAASLLVHITSQASAYFENAWFWVADHDLDIPAQTQIDIYVGRGVLIESTGPVWLYGTASEHCVLYQYQTVDASNVFMGMIQTESPYYQVAPQAPAPFDLVSSFSSDPPSMTAILINSESIYIYGAGLYSWFSEYSQACLLTEDCQERLFEIETSSDIWIYSLITKASVEMISPAAGVPVFGADNKINFCSVVMAWLGSALGGSDAINGVKHLSPISATVVPFPATTVASTATFTIGPVGGAIISNINAQQNLGNQNQPKGPGEAACLRCDLARLITSTCCGIGGSVSNPIEILPGVRLSRDLILLAGFVPNQEITGKDSQVYPAGVPLPGTVILPSGTIFLFPFVIPPGLGLSNTYTPSATGDDEDGDLTMYIITTFWEGPHTVSCSYPCTLLFPPSTTRSTWTPRPITTSRDGVTETITLPVQTVLSIRISKTTVTSSEGSSPTKIIFPVPAPRPLCFKITLPFLGTITIGFCPPKINPFPPPIPEVTVIPVPPGKKPGPTTKNNKPAAEHEQEEEEEEEEEDEDESGGTCPVPPYLDDEGFSDDFSFDPDEEDGGSDEDGNTIGAGTGTPVTTTVFATETAQVTVRVPVTSTVLVPAPPTATPPVPQPTPNPTPPKPRPDTEVARCWLTSSYRVKESVMYEKIYNFCNFANGREVDSMNEFKKQTTLIDLKSGKYYSRVGVLAQNGCWFQIQFDECFRILNKVLGCAPKAAPELRIGGTVDTNFVSFHLGSDLGRSCPPWPLLFVLIRLG
ncbi:pectate lyase superfamily protein-domain-containing protein [Leptodontidium sp. 2 PMI_412]|nr:pectate lyase superfamily protein-domain-containing protein [Leptodontidium sp. 2 PMI_412]